ncbi:MAG: SpoIIE family protein phosphatase, partial [Tepidisphaeraceae bacterium]
TYLMRGRGGRLEIGQYDAKLAPNNCVESVIDLTGRIDPKPVRLYRYEPRERPWYRRAVESPEPVWTDIYFWFGNQGADSATGAGYTRVIRSPDGAVAGVLVVDVTLAALSRFLRDLPLSESGFAFIVDESNLLVASSHGPVNSDTGERLPIDRAGPAARAASLLLTPSRAARRSRIPAAQRSIVMDDQAARAEVMTLRPYPGVNWRLVVILPEASFLSEADAMQRRSIYLALGATLGAILLGWSLANRLSRPLQQLGSHVTRVGGGDFDARLHLQEARELAQLSADINKMAAGLRHRVELEQSLALATQIQQSLLPEKLPKVPGLDIAGNSRFCDSTGGDYYDFLDVAGMPAGGALVVIGDVTGHGIGAALLMASARAAVRASAPVNPALNDLMGRVNRVLSDDQRHGLFMTLLLMVVDPQRRSIRWSSAGHDPVMIYDPATGNVTEPEGGDLMLGVMSGAPYEEFSLDSLPHNAVIFTGTDGIWEAVNEQGDMFGKERLRKLLQVHGKSAVSEIGAALEQALRDFAQTRALNDDVTYVVMKFTEDGRR